MSNNKWYQKKEKAGILLLKITIYAVVYLPTFLLKFLIFIITLFYYGISRQERQHIDTYIKNLQSYFKNETNNKILKISSFSIFYAFSESICDKIAVWKCKIMHKDLIFYNEEYLYKELYFGYGEKEKKGQILLVSHFGNIEVFRAMIRYIKGIKIAILVYHQNSQAFANIMNEISKTELIAFDVRELSIAKMLELSELLNNGCHIGIMADRVSLNEKKNIKVKFLGKDCYFPTGAFILAGILKCAVTTVWCEKSNGKYYVDAEKITDNIVLSRDKKESVRKYVEQYISILEKHIKNNPTQWFNFYDFWKEGNENDK